MRSPAEPCATVEACFLDERQRDRADARLPHGRPDPFGRPARDRSMSTTDPVVSRDELGLARILLVDMKVRSLLVAEARRRGITRVFGIPRADQSTLVTMMV